MKALKNIIRIFVIASALVITSGIYSQHEHHNHNHNDSVKTDTVKTDTTKSHEENGLHDEHGLHNEHGLKNQNKNEQMMPHSYSLSLPMNRNGSGTGMLPDVTPMSMYMLHSGSWMFMFHGNVFLRYTETDITKEGTRGLSKWDAPNWFMAMAQRKMGGNGLLKFGLMMSLDRLTENGSGYPLLFQSGETWEGKPLVDRQHPHDLFSELSIGYTHRLNKDIDLTGYFGYPGEPALGPVAFMHRVSSFNNPDAPLSHHWQDATHITFGVATLGFRYKSIKLEGSTFTGSEPDEERYGFDKINMNSYSYRISVNPTPNFAFQFSQGFIKSPEALEPGVDVARTTASVIHSHNFSAFRSINTTFAWGLNDKGHDHREHSFLLESNMQMNKLAVYGRYEFVQKSPEELSLEGFEHDEIFNINALTLGANYRIFQFAGTDVSLGLQGSIYFTPGGLETIYGKNPLSAQVYLKISPSFISSMFSNKSHKH
jgi:hypothetical protein